ncbi:MAG: hypothetical protein H7831_11675 [Magnetococcus sp. WYHC-3]
MERQKSDLQNDLQKLSQLEENLSCLEKEVKLKKECIAETEKEWKDKAQQARKIRLQTRSIAADMIRVDLQEPVVAEPQPLSVLETEQFLEPVKYGVDLKPSHSVWRLIFWWLFFGGAITLALASMHFDISAAWTAIMKYFGLL